MAKLPFIELDPHGAATRIPILYEDRSVLAIDKPAGWLLAPIHWQKTSRNLQAAIESSIAGREFWARSRNLRFLRFIHRLDADTSGVLLCARSPGALTTYSELFESHRVEKVYLAVVVGVPREREWTCTLPLAPNESQRGKMKVDRQDGKPTETWFRVLQTGARQSLVEVRPRTGRTHQIRVHLVTAGHPVVGDSLYGAPGQRGESLTPEPFPLGLRAVALRYADPFTRKQISIHAEGGTFIRAFGFQPMAPE